eukprot:m.338459 g.338459  ORF g.338459 m.338459 type:complete len:662 (-) comp18425_c0_seq1:111-2096(-)
MEQEAKTLFVPGRICLFGEHSDWSGGFRRFNSDITPGATIVSGTNQGLYARVKTHPNCLVLSSTTDTGEKFGPLSIPMRKQDLLEEARKGTFFSYVCGVAYKILTDYTVGGLCIENFKTTLPTCKGLSSSAAVCVLVARAFNTLYDLKMTVRGEMEYAYQGEILTPSQCGRMDQGCAYGDRPILMKYDGEFLDVDELTMSSTPLHYVLVDLQGSKSTTEILKGLQEGFPVARTDIHKGVHDLLGPINKDITERACKLLAVGDAEGLGKLMFEAQAAFDKYAQPACPSQLTMPLLHKVMTHPKLLPLVYGIKGVGSQGDGTGQLLCKNAKAQEEVQKILQDELNMPSLLLTLSSGPEIKSAVIPAAGFGQNHFPATLPVRAELFPIVTKSGVAKPIIFYNVESLVQAGIERIFIVVQEEDLHSFERLFKKPVSRANYAKLSQANQEYSKQILKMGEKVEFIVQEQQEGFGHAVYCAKDKIGNEPFLLMLGDHLYHTSAPDGASCVKQMLDAYKRHQRSIVGLKRTNIQEVSSFGAMSGVFLRDNPNDDGTGTDAGHKQLLDVSVIAEKPTISFAKEHLAVPGLDDSEVLTVFGQYIISPKVFTFLEENISSNVRDNGDFAFTPALQRLQKEDGLLGLLVEGQRLDIGSPESYMRTIQTMVQD